MSFLSPKGSLQVRHIPSIPVRMPSAPTDLVCPDEPHLDPSHKHLLPAVPGARASASVKAARKQQPWGCSRREEKAGAEGNPSASRAAPSLMECSPQAGCTEMVRATAFHQQSGAHQTRWGSVMSKISQGNPVWDSRTAGDRRQVPYGVAQAEMGCQGLSLKEAWDHGRGCECLGGVPREAGQGD